MRKTNSKDEASLNPTRQTPAHRPLRSLGAGKDAVLNQNEGIGLSRPVYHHGNHPTPAAPREDNVDYHFVSEARLPGDD